MKWFVFTLFFIGAVRIAKMMDRAKNAAIKKLHKAARTDRQKKAISLLDPMPLLLFILIMAAGALNIFNLKVSIGDKSLNSSNSNIGQMKKESYKPEKIDVQVEVLSSGKSKIRNVGERKPIEYDGKKIGWSQKVPNDLDGAIAYWKKNNGLAPFAEQYNIPEPIIFAIMWVETRWGNVGAGRKGALAGIKYRNQKGTMPVKSFDRREKKAGINNGRVMYATTKERWQYISLLCKTLNKPLYRNRYKGWKEKLHSEKATEYIDLEAWALALQDHPYKNTNISYATCGCKDMSDIKCYEKRIHHSYKILEVAKRYNG